MQNTFEEVDLALVTTSRLLSEGLRMLEYLARSQNNSGVEAWASAELMGYNTKQERLQLPAYRCGLRAANRHAMLLSNDIANGIKRDLSGLDMITYVDVWQGVLELEQVLAAEPTWYGNALVLMDIKPEAIFHDVPSLCHRIRMEARTKLVRELAPRDTSNTE